MRGKGNEKNMQSEKKILEFYPKRRIARCGPNEITFTGEKELFLFELLFQQRGTFVDDDEILKVLWNDEQREKRDISNIREVVWKVRRKLEVLGVTCIRKNGRYGMLDENDCIDGIKHETVKRERPILDQETSIFGSGKTIKLVKITDKDNEYGYDTIEILVFNYDGSGGAIAKLDGELEFIHKNDLTYILFGDPLTGERWYEPVETKQE